MTSRHTRPASATSVAAGTLLATASLLGGIVVGGWLAFETPHWQAFKAFVEGLPLLSGLQLGVLLVLVGVAGAVAIRALSTRR